MAEHNDFGKAAEAVAAKYLQDKGYKILSKNYRSQKAEIDLVAETETEIIIAEVKARSYNAVLEPHEAVTPRKIKHLVAAADAYVLEYNICKPVRFDIISVLPDASGQLQITHIENAFESIDAK